MLHTTLAYKYVMTMAIVAFVNHYAPRLNLPFEVPLKDQEIQRLGVTTPECDEKMTYYGGGIRVDNYSIGFTDGFLNRSYSPYTGYFVITKLEDDGMTSFGIPLLHLNESSVSLMERASRMKYTVSTNDLYQLATNYLVALEIDQNTFEKRNPLSVEQGDFHSHRGLVPSPLMCVYWGEPMLRDPGSNGLAFEISAVSGELLELHAGNASGCKRLPLLKDLGKLLAISDKEFLTYSTLDRSNLLVNFAGLHCSDLHCPGFDEPLPSQMKAPPNLRQNTNSTSKQ
jgi:hypothetical protein